jgi:hypothetical protein
MRMGEAAMNIRQGCERIGVSAKTILPRLPGAAAPEKPSRGAGFKRSAAEKSRVLFLTWCRSNIISFT